MKRKISLLALLLTLILVSSCAKNNPFSVNDTTNNNDSSILPDNDDGSIPPESNGGIHDILDTTKILGIYSSEYTFYSLSENLFRNRWPTPMNVTITKIGTGSGIEITIDCAGKKFSFQDISGSIKEGTYYLKGYMFDI
ncbi:hypothetical protein R4J03_04490 [Brachyspira intermedia]|uniref:hypothetical protein n=1 Tax=Brachyspira intermedia TaxID=84377 RepID=UPI0030056288